MDASRGPRGIFADWGTRHWEWARDSQEDSAGTAQRWAGKMWSDAAKSEYWL